MTIRGFTVEVRPNGASLVQMDSGVQEVHLTVRDLCSEFDARMTLIEILDECI